MSSKRSNANSNLPDAATLARIEAAVAGLARAFATEAREMAAQMKRLLDGAWPHSAQPIFRLAHDLKGQGKTFGFPEVTRRAAAL